MDRKQGFLDAFLAPLGEQIVNPNGAVTDLLAGKNPAEEAARREEEKRRAALAAEEEARRLSVMEAAAAQPAKPMSSWNPFVALFGQPGDPNDKGLIGR